MVEQGIAALEPYNCRDSLRFALSHAGEEEPAGCAGDPRELLQTRKEQFIAAMEDDLNTADAIATLFELVRTSIPG